MVGIAIPAYKDSRRLTRALNSIKGIDASWLERTTVVDDSGDGHVAAAVQPQFPSVRFVIHGQNQGFAEAANRAVSECHDAIVVLLNDDAELIADPRSHLTEAFERDNLFSVSLESVDENGRFREGAKRIVWQLGIAKVQHNERDQISSSHWLKPSSYSVGGHAAFRTDVFRSLGGFRNIFAPFYWEDADLCERARKSGYQTLFLPFACVRHSRDGAIRSNHEQKEIRRITLRNRFLYSLIHVQGAQKSLQPIGLMIRKISAYIARDDVERAALHEALRAFNSFESKS